MIEATAEIDTAINEMQDADVFVPNYFRAVICGMWNDLHCLKPISEKAEEALLACIKAWGERQAEEAIKTAEKQASVFVGEIGERLEMTVEVVATASGQNNYGDYWFFYLLRDTTTSNLFVHIGSAICTDEEQANKGDTLTMKGTVKAHEERDGVNQTRINRPKASIITKTEVQ
jgi:hypothetical protein